MSPPTSVKVTYFDGKGRAEAIRLALTIGGIKFEDDRLDYAGFGKLSATGVLPFGSLPVITLDGKIHAQSVAILRYVAKLAGLYPEDALTALVVDEIIDGVGDLMAESLKVLYAQDDAAKKKNWEELMKEAYPRYMTGIEKLIQDKGISVGAKMTIADLIIYTTVGGFYERLPGFNDQTLAPYPKVVAVYKAVEANANVQAWNKAHPPKPIK